MSRYKKSNLPKQSRTIRRKADKFRGARSAGGTGEDYKKYYRCWNCGFVCNEDRDALGGSSSGDGISIIPFTIPISIMNALLYMGDSVIGNAYVIGDDTTINEPVKRNLKPDVNSGCPFCGSLNWRGDY